MNINEERNKMISELRELRLYKGLTLRTVANRMGRDTAFVSRLETNKAAPTLNNFMLYLNAIDCQIYIKSKCYKSINKDNNENKNPKEG